MMQLDQSTLKSMLHYNPATGVFIWKNPNKHGTILPGDIAGGHGNCGYLRIGVNNRRYQAHLLAWLYVYGRFPEREIDHINHIRDDNRIANLREVGGAANKLNLSKAKNNKSGVTGVSWAKPYQAWVAQLQWGGKQMYFGRYADIFEAICARKSAEVKYGFHLNHGIGEQMERAA